MLEMKTNTWVWESVCCRKARGGVTLGWGCVRGLGALINWPFFNWERGRTGWGAHRRGKTPLGFNWGVPVTVFSFFLSFSAQTALRHDRDGHVSQGQELLSNLRRPSCSVSQPTQSRYNLAAWKIY